MCLICRRMALCAGCLATETGDGARHSAARICRRPAEGQTANGLWLGERVACALRAPCLSCRTMQRRTGRCRTPSRPLAKKLHGCRCRVRMPRPTACRLFLGHFGVFSCKDIVGFLLGNHFSIHVTFLQGQIGQFLWRKELETAYAHMCSCCGINKAEKLLALASHWVSCQS